MSARVARNEDRPFSQNCAAATIDQSIICAGIQRSGPIFLLMSCEGNSASKKESLETVFPRLKSAPRVSRFGPSQPSWQVLTICSQAEVLEKVISVRL